MTGYPPEAPDWRPAVALEHERGTAAVCRDPDGSLWLVSDLDDLSNPGDWDDEPPDDEEDWDPREEFGDELLGYETAGAGTSVDGIAALAGRLPDGAVRVEVRDGSDRPVSLAVDQGVWLALPDPSSQVEPVVLFFGADGSPIRRPLPEHVSVEPLPQTEEACPGCGAREWELASVPSRDSPGAELVFSYEWESGERAAVCSTCGYVQALPRKGETQHIVVESPKLDPAEQHERWETRVTGVWASLGTAPIGLTRNWSGARRLGSWGGGGSPDEPSTIDSVTLYHGECLNAGDPCLSVTTHAEKVDDDLLSGDQWLEENLVAALSDQWRDFDATDDDGGDLREQLRRREVQARVHAMDRKQISVRIDDVPVSFLKIGEDDAWCAYADHGGPAITIVARRFPLAQVALESADVKLYLSH